MTNASLIMLTAGGTGGHMFPAEALAAELSRRGHPLAFVTDRRGAAYGEALGAASLYRIHGGAIAGKGLIAKLVAFAALALGYFEARRLISALRPAAVVGFGGYASVPAVLAASHKGVPSLVHEQNGVLGRANRLLASAVSAIATAYDRVGNIKPAWADKIRRTGMPVRPALLTLREQPYPALFGHGPITLLVVGGSQGARIFSDLVPAALLRLPEHLQRRLRVFQQCRAEDLERVQALYHQHHIDCDLRSFFDDMPARLAEAHLVIGRSGASTVAELEAAGRPAILVPYPHAIDDHQTANASAFAATGGGWLMPQSTLTPEALAQFLEQILSDPDALNEAARLARAAAIPDAAGRLADLVLELAEVRP